jgi:small-conductance mechanosensitive channel
MRFSLLVGAILWTIGVAVVALPDSDNRLFSLSQAHGPSPVDALGALVMIAGWLVFVAALWRRRDRIVRQSGTPAGGAIAFALGLGAGLLVASAVGDFAYWWAVGAALLVAGQLLLVCWPKSPSARDPRPLLPREESVLP